MMERYSRTCIERVWRWHLTVSDEMVRRFALRKVALLNVIAVSLLASFASAQQGDAMIGFGTLMSSGTTSCGQSSCFVPEKGGLYTNISGDVVFKKRIGFNFEAAWKASQGNYAGLGIPFRPILFDFNGLYQPQLSPKVSPHLLGVVRRQAPRFYGTQPTIHCVIF